MPSNLNPGCQSVCYSNEFDVVSLEGSSDNSNRSLKRNIQDKLIIICNDLLSLINTSNDQEKQMIFKEFDIRELQVILYNLFKTFLSGKNI